MKAIETIYNGYKFRSRLEARWAVFFDTLGIPWEYEKEGYDLDGVWYLPDFWLPKQKFWIEVKGNNPTTNEWEKACKLNELTHREVFILSGPIPNVSEDSDFFDFPQYSPMGGDHDYTWCDCPDCGFVGIQWSGYSDRLACKQCEICYLIEHRKTCLEWLHPTEKVLGRISLTVQGCYQCIGEKVYEVCPYHGNTPHKGCPPHSAKMSKYPTYNSPRLIAAYTAARQARFEHQ